MKLLVFTTSFITIAVIACRSQFTNGNYNLKVDRVTSCPEYPNEKLLSPLYASWSKYNKTHHVLNANITLSIPIDEQTTHKAHMYKWGDGGWKIFLNMTRNNACAAFKLYLGDLWVDILRAGGFKLPKQCPLSKGFYAWHNYIVPVNLFKQTFLIGSFKFDMFIIKGNITHTCIKVFFQTMQIYNY